MPAGFVFLAKSDAAAAAAARNVAAFSRHSPRAQRCLALADGLVAPTDAEALFDTVMTIAEPGSAAFVAEAVLEAPFDRVIVVDAGVWCVGSLYDVFAGLRDRPLAAAPSPFAPYTDMAGPRTIAEPEAAPAMTPPLEGYLVGFNRTLLSTACIEVWRRFAQQADAEGAPFPANAAARALMAQERISLHALPSGLVVNSAAPAFLRGFVRAVVHTPHAERDAFAAFINHDRRPRLFVPPATLLVQDQKAGVWRVLGFDRGRVLVLGEAEMADFTPYLHALGASFGAAHGWRPPPEQPQAAKAKTRA